MNETIDYGDLIELAGERLAIVLPEGGMLIIEGTGKGGIEQIREGKDNDYIRIISDREDLIQIIFDSF